MTQEEELEYWRKDSAAAWDKCEEYRLEIERLTRELKGWKLANRTVQAEYNRMMEAERNGLR